MAIPRIKAFHDLAIGITRAVSPLLPNHVPMALLGSGSHRDLCSVIAEGGVRRPLVVTDAVLVKLGIVGQVTAALQDVGVASSIYDGVEPDPTLDHVRAGLGVLRSDGCDAVLAVGGGSSIDAAKVIAAGATSPKPFEKLEGLMKVRRAPLPLFAVPTTAGTGSEGTIAAVVSHPVTHAKKFFVDPKLLPQATALDPALMTGLPPAITAATGMDALTHAVESWLSRTSTEQTERWASAAIALIFANLPTACRDGANLPARRAMAVASYYAGLAFTRTSVGYVHAIAHQLGAHYRTPHGLANALVLPHVLEYSIGPGEKAMAAMARRIGLSGSSDAALARAFLDAVRTLAREVGIPTTLDALRPSDIPTLAEEALAESYANYPVPRWMGRADCEQLITRLLPSA